MARLYTDGAFRKKIEGMFEGDYKLVFHLAPPLLAKPDPRTGEPAKMQFGAWMLGLFGVLAKLKGLRGTAFDIFGRTEERRMERALIGEYEQTVETLLAGLTRDNHALAVEIASLPETIRGYGHIKAKSVEARAQEARRTARALPRRAGPRRGMSVRTPRLVLLAGTLLLAAGARRRRPRKPARSSSKTATQPHLHAAHLSARCAPAAAGREARPDQRAGRRPSCINLHLSDGDIEEAALLSNAPRRRYEVLRDYREIDRRRRVQARLRAILRSGEPRCSPKSSIDNRTPADLGPARRRDASIAGQYFVEVDGRYLIDDVPNEQRTRLRWVLEAYRAGKLPR